MPFYFFMSHYYDQTQTSKSNPKTFTFNYRNLEFVFKTDSGVFSKNYIDFGSYLLIDNYEPNSLEGPVLDMCSGYGVIGIVLKKLYNLDVYQTDINLRCYNLNKDNLLLNNVETKLFTGNLYESLPECKFKDILVNPPIRAGKEVIFAIYKGAYERLMEKGSLYVVIQKKQGAPSTIKYLENLFSKVSIINHKKGYYIIKAERL